MMSRHWRGLLAIGIAACSLSATPAQAQSVEQFYKGRSITLLVGTAPGGINDISARLVAKYLGRFVPGSPAVVVQNNPGAGGLITANKLYNSADKDGSVLAKFERAVPQLQIQGDPNAQFDSTKFVWLGSISSYANDAYFLLVNAGGRVKSLTELQRGGMPINLGSDNSASSNFIFAVIAKEVLGLNVNVIRGYTGAASLFLGMQRGELDGQYVGLSSIKSGQRDLWNKGAFRPLMAFGRTTRHPDFADVPIGRELTNDPTALKLIGFAELPFFMALPFAAPPGIPADRAKALQAAFMDMSRNEEFIAEAEKIGVDVSPIDAAAILKLLNETASTPKDVIGRYNSIAGEKK
jgi:tripartite-type tricarboxylate transporter receptor subunit TctC